MGLSPAVSPRDLDVKRYRASSKPGSRTAYYQSEREAYFEDMYRMHGIELYKAAWRLAKNLQSVEDLLQETYLKAWNAFDTFRSGTNSRAWLLRIMTNAYIDIYRKEERSPENIDREYEEEIDHRNGSGRQFLLSQNDPELVVDALIDERAERAIQSLPENFREVVRLYCIEGLTANETARRLGIPIGTVMSRSHRAKYMLARDPEILNLAEESGYSTNSSAAT